MSPSSGPRPNPGGWDTTGACPSPLRRKGGGPPERFRKSNWRAGGVSPLMTPRIRGLTPPARLSAQTVAAVDAETAAHAIVLAAAAAQHDHVGQRAGALDAVRRAHLVRRLALGTLRFLRDALPLQV